MNPTAMSRVNPRQLLEYAIFPQLRKISKAGSWQWKACCPAHDDNSPSFSIKVADDGRILFHCFAGCEIREICEALHISVDDLFPDDGHYTPVRKPVTEPTEDTFYIAICKSRIRKGLPLTDAEKNQYMAAIKREARR